MQAGAVLGDLPQDLGYTGGTSFVEVGDDSVIREGVTIHRGTADGSVTRVGKHCYLMGNSLFGLNIRQALTALDEDGQALATEFAAFIRGAKKGDLWGRLACRND